VSLQIRCADLAKAANDGERLEWARWGAHLRIGIPLKKPGGVGIGTTTVLVVVLVLVIGSR
jgi:hypothetical protein